MRGEQEQIWYGPCGWWTSDWSKLSRIPGSESQPGAAIQTSGIPCCPHCMGGGFMAVFDAWKHGIAKHTAKHPRYDEFVESLRDADSCHKSRGSEHVDGMRFDWQSAYEDFINETK